MRRRHFFAALAFLIGGLVAVVIAGGDGYSLNLLWWPVGVPLHKRASPARFGPVIGIVRPVIIA